MKANLRSRAIALLVVLAALAVPVAVTALPEQGNPSPEARCYFTWVSHPFLHWTYVCVPDNGGGSW